MIRFALFQYGKNGPLVANYGFEQKANQKLNVRI
jgi:hypothetical protein